MLNLQCIPFPCPRCDILGHKIYGALPRIPVPSSGRSVLVLFLKVDKVYLTVVSILQTCKELVVDPKKGKFSNLGEDDLSSCRILPRGRPLGTFILLYIYGWNV